MASGIPCVCASFIDPHLPPPVGNRGEDPFDERPDRALAWAKEIIDERGWQTIADIFRHATYKTMKAAEAAKGRVEAGEAEPMLASWALLLFKSPFKEESDGSDESGPGA